MLANASIGRGGTWNRDGFIVFAPAANGPLHRISAGGGEAVEVTKLESTRHVGHRFPQFLPDGQHFIFNSPGNLEGRGLYLGSLDSTRVRRLADADSQAIYVRAGYLLFIRQEALLAQRFDLSSFQLSGEPTAVVEKVSSDPLALLGAFSSAVGILAYRGAGSISRQLVWFDRSGKSVGVVGSPDKDNPFNPNIAPER